MAYLVSNPRLINISGVLKYVFLNTISDAFVLIILIAHSFDEGDFDSVSIIIDK